jgi:hypothetical protein
VKPYGVAVWALAGAGLARACPLGPADGAVLRQGDVQLAWRAEPQRMQMGTPFALQISVCPADARLAAVDASMPEHAHGMNYRPSLQALGDGRWRAVGLLWHMSGRWELRFDIVQADVRHTLRQSMLLP